MSEYNLFNRWTIKRKTFWWIVGGGAGGLLVLFFLLVMFSGFGGASDYYDYGYTNNDEMMSVASDMAEDSAGFSESEKSYSDAPMAMAPQAYDGETTTIDFTERMIIREGIITIPVESTRSSRDAIEALVVSFADKGAYVVSSSEYASYEGAEPYINMVIRIPVEQFAFVIDELSDMAKGNVTMNTWSDDVSEEYSDLENRLTSLEAARLRLLDIMENADTTEDLLAAEQQLTYRESEIESIKGRMKYLSESSDLSRVSLYLEPYILSQPIDTKWAPLETIRYAFEELLDSIQGFADWFIVFVIATLPWLIVIGVVIWLVIRRVKKKRKQKAE